jgi:hypothetical protein
MSITPLVWKAEPGTARSSAFTAHLGRLITYHAASRSDDYSAYVEVRGPGGGLKRLDLGCYDTMTAAKGVCELHCTTGCDLSRAERIIEPRRVARVGKP